MVKAHGVAFALALSIGPAACHHPVHHPGEEFLEAIANSTHPEHLQLVQWSGGAYDPASFDPTRIAFDNPRQRWKKAFQE